ncbi:uncharacterized protein LOC111692154 [Anoplophora glabripennis]|uniref:uncharacterized protein LOC111692154 n=1 Tax=Anoplophora glabripennis TaxID=217634 RepID=UPI000C77FB4E|nr:uncharacterized protein LOC111692154 [Anoplophora glabripennis]
MTSMVAQMPTPFILRLTHFISVFGITPWYNFEQHKLVRPMMFKFYSSFLVLLLASSTIGLVWLRYRLIFNCEFSLNTAIDIFLDLESLVTVSLPIVVTFWDPHAWVKLYKAYSRVDASTETVSYAGNSAFMLRYAAPVFVLGNVYLFSMHHINDLILKYISDFSVYYFSTFVLNYYEFLIAFTIIGVSALIKSKYQCINELLVARNSNGDFIKTAKEVRILWLRMEDIVQDFNRLFGWPLLLLFFDFFLDILTALICATFATDNSVYRMEGGAAVANAFYLFQSAIWLTAIIFCCDSVVTETDELLTNCYRLEQTLPLFSKELEELDSLKKLIRNKRPKLTAAGFFEIRRSTLLSLLSTTTTYFIVALQFNSL